MKNWMIIAALILFGACDNDNANKAKNVANDKNLWISVDESFRPVIAEQIKVFESAYPQTKVNVEYKPEADCIRDLEKDSTKIVIISRELSPDETNSLNGKMEFKPEFALMAQDAIAVIVNATSADTVFTMAEIKQMLAGTGNKKYNVAIDGNTATSTVRYLRDSVLRGGAFGKNITGAKNSEELINYIATSPGAIGYVGVSWITNPQTVGAEEDVKKVKMALVECRNCEKDVFAKPSQQTITFGQYPLVRGLYYVLKENYAGVGSRFVNFLSTERGQLIFKRALLVPSKIQFNRRRTDISESE